jgi:hypothetical protein
MAKNDAASIITLHQVPQKRPKTGAERVAAHRARKRAAAKPPAATVTLPAVSPADVAPPVTRRNGWRLPEPPSFANLEKSTAELVEACQKGIAAARVLFGRVDR